MGSHKQTYGNGNGLMNSVDSYHGDDRDFVGSDDPTTKLLTSSMTRSIDIPKDHFRAVYIIMGLLGMGGLLPWNMFITASEYYDHKFRYINTTNTTNMDTTELRKTYENFFSVTAMSSNILMLVLNTALKHLVSLNLRIFSGMIVTLIMFVFTTCLVVVDTDSWQMTFFIVTLVSVVVINLAGALFQGSLIGVAGVLPPEYMQSTMSGQAIAGIFASLTNILAIAAASKPESSGFGYFLSAVAAMFLCIIVYAVLLKLPFYKYYMNITKEESINSDTTVENKKKKPPFRLIFKKIWLMAVLVLLVFAVSLGCFPAVTSKVESMSTDPKSVWATRYFTPVTCFLLFNTGDCIGRVLTGWIQWPDESGYGLTILILLRTAFFPLFALCNVEPRGHNTPVVFNNDAYFIVFMAVFAISNGYLGTLCMIYGPKKVQDDHKETAGNIMALFLSLGLGIGAALSFIVTETI
ncbi:equilibrative nucleoside transporter 1-like [Glandiceps talaboti]